MWRRLIVSLLVITSALALSAATSTPRPAIARAGCGSFSTGKCTIRLRTGITMRYLQVGPANGPTVLLLHGYTDTSRSWARVLPVLHRLLPHLHIIVPDQRGHGATSLPRGRHCRVAPKDCFRPIDFARDIIAFMDARHIRRAAIVGHSMGSAIAQELALSFPDRVTRMAVLSTAGNGHVALIGQLLNGLVDGAWRQSFQARGYRWPRGVYGLSPALAAPGFGAFLRTVWVADPIAPPRFLNQIRPETRRIRLGTWIGALKDLYHVNQTGRLRYLRVPVLVLWSIQDDIFSRGDESVLIRSLSAAARSGGSFWWKQYGVLPPPASGAQTDFGHNLLWEAPAPVARDIASFLSTGRPTTTLYHTDWPRHPRRVIAEPGRALLIHRP